MKPVRSVYQKYRTFQLVPQKISYWPAKPVYHWLWWLWGENVSAKTRAGRGRKNGKSGTGHSENV